MNLSKPKHLPAARIDGLLAEIAEHFKTLPRVDRARAFREALSYHRLPGGYSRRDAVARTLTQSLDQLKGIL